MEFDVRNKSSANMQELEIMIDKLLNPVCEIRWRALQNILSKLSYGLLNLEELLEIKSGRLCEYLLKWFSSDSYSIPDPKLVLKFFLKIITETVNGIRIMINLNARHILQHWVTGHLEDNEISNFVRDICSELLTTVQMEKPAEANQTLKYGESDDSSEQHKVDNSSNSITENTVTTSTNSFSSPARFLLKNRDNYIASKIPQHLLEPTSSMSDHQSNGQHMPKNGPRLYSPITRSYLKRKVTFNHNSECEEIEDTDNTGIDATDIINIMFPFSSLLSEWHTLTKVDRDLLDNIASRLKSNEPPEIRSALQELTAFVLEDFPGEILLQRPNIVFSIQDLLVLQHDVSLKLSSAGCLERIMQKLQTRLRFCSNSGFVGRKNCDILFADSVIGCQRAYTPEDSKG